MKRTFTAYFEAAEEAYEAADVANEAGLDALAEYLTQRAIAAGIIALCLRPASKPITKRPDTGPR